MNFPKRITVCEVSTRDGFQTLPPPTVAEKLTILDLIVKSGIHEIEVGSFVDKGSNLMCGMESTPEIFRVMERKAGGCLPGAAADPHRYENGRGRGLRKNQTEYFRK